MPGLTGTQDHCRKMKEKLQYYFYIEKILALLLIQLLFLLLKLLSSPKFSRTEDRKGDCGKKVEVGSATAIRTAEAYHGDGVADASNFLTESAFSPFN